MTGKLAASAPAPLRPDAATEASSRLRLEASASAEAESEDAARRAYQCQHADLGPPLDPKFFGQLWPLTPLWP